MSELHSRIRTLRLQQRRTLKDIADRCDFTVSLLSKIEAGKISPPIATLTRIAGALGVSIADLLSGKNDRKTSLSRADTLQKTPLSPTDKGYEFHLIAGDRSDKFMQPFIFEAERGKVKPSSLTHLGEEFVYMLKGQMRYRVGSETFVLDPGDSLYFSSEEEHDLEPLSAKVRYLAVFAEPPKAEDSPNSKRKKKK